MFIMVDGIEGSGKSTILEAWKEHLTNEGKTLFDLKDYWKEHGKHPEFSEMKSYDFILTSEPSYVGIGKVIREELIKNGTSYPGRAIAEAYSLDRLIIYNKIVIPALREGKCIIQDRGVSTSLCYQPLTDPSVSRTWVSELSGNALALDEHRPDHLILLQIDPERATNRLSGRLNKQDDAIFEKLDFQKKIAKVFASSEYQQFFTARGTQVHNLPAEDELAIMKERAISLLKDLLMK